MLSHQGATVLLTQIARCSWYLGALVAKRILTPQIGLLRACASMPVRGRFQSHSRTISGKLSPAHNPTPLPRSVW
jgi:hypothetical protein